MSQRLGQVYQAVSESIRRSVDWSGLLGTNLITGSVWTTKPTGLVLVGTGKTTTSTTIELTAGVAGVTYTVENEITFAGTQKRKRHFLLTVEG